MKLFGILSEAWRNLATGTTRALTYTAILIVVASATAAFDLTSILALQHESRQWLSSGAAVHIISGSKQIDSVTCANLTRTSGTKPDGVISQPIQASGAIRSSGEITLSAMPSTSLDVWQATSNFAEILGISEIQQSHAGVWISSQLAATLHVREGDDVSTSQGDMHISAVFSWPDDGRDQRLSYAILVSTNASPDETWDECWASINPSNADAEDLLNTAAIAIPGVVPTTQTKQANAMFGSTLDLASQYRQRVTRLMLAVTPIAAFAIALVSVRVRKIEIADNLHMGILRTSVQATTVLETLAWSLPAILATTAAIYLAVAWNSGQANADTLTIIQLPSLAASLVSAQAGAAAGIASICDSQLFAFFKNRQ